MHSLCSRITPALLMAALFLLTACAAIQGGSAPALTQRPAERIQLPATLVVPEGGWPSSHWWAGFKDPQLDILIDTALSDSPRVAVARARIAAAAARLGEASGSKDPALGLSASLDREHVSASSFIGPFAQNIPAAGLTGPWYTQGTLGLEGAYEFDPWGKHHQIIEAAIGARKAREAEAAETERLLSGQIAHTYFEIQSLSTIRQLLKQAQETQTELIVARESRVHRGLESQTQLEPVRALGIDLEKRLAALDDRRSILVESLRTLVGAGPELPLVIEPSALRAAGGGVPDSLGYELLARRPDLQALHWYVQASMSEVEVAKAAFYPSFDLKAFFGYDALHLADLLHKPSEQVNIIPGLSLPIFDRGRLNAQLGNAAATRDILIAQYNDAILNAVREVAQSGIELEGVRRQQTLQDARLKTTTFGYRSATAHQQTGLLDRSAMLAAKLPMISDQIEQVALASHEIHAEIALVLALGGGYRSDPSSEPAARAAGSRSER